MTKKLLCMTVMLCIVCFLLRQTVYASDDAGEEYITISIDAIDDNGDLKYALDTDDPSAFTESNEFVVPAGTSHTIYVKDAAGNVSSQVYEGDIQTEERHGDTEDEQKINIDLELGGSKKGAADYGDNIRPGEPAEAGSATVGSKIITDGSSNAERIFYTFTTKEGEVLYLVVDQGQGTDNVYLLDTVSIGDLKALADGRAAASGTDVNKQEDNLLSALSASNDAEDEMLSEQKAKKDSSSRNNNIFIVLLFVAIGGGAYYYLKVYKNKKNDAMDAMDAMDLDEFAPEEEEEEIDFEYDDSDKERYLEQLINEDEEFFDADPEIYATSHMDVEDYRDGADLEEVLTEEGYASADNDEDDGEEM